VLLRLLSRLLLPPLALPLLTVSLSAESHGVECVVRSSLAACAWLSMRARHWSCWMSTWTTHNY
jgi:hypothetical protein